MAYPNRSKTANESSRWELVTLGETMVAFIDDGDGDRFRATCIGAESNVAISFVQLGGRALWASRLGNDGLGRLVHRNVSGAGVEVRVEWDETRPTGVAVKEVGGPEGSRVRYYRSQSAARLIHADLIPEPASARWLHVTGITPALSAIADTALDEVIARTRQAGAKISFDVNLRPGLWSNPEVARKRLLGLAAAADLIFVGSDEAEALTGNTDPLGFAAACGLVEHQELVFKDGPRMATVLRDGQVQSAPALRVPVTDVTGAGDAFAAGYLAASCRELDGLDRLRWGHWNAARVVQITADVPPPPSKALLRELGSLSTSYEDTEWSSR